MGSLIHPCMGIALSDPGLAQDSLQVSNHGCRLTLVEHVTERAVVQYHDLAKIRLHRAQVFDESPVSECAVLPVVSRREKFPL